MKVRHPKKIRRTMEKIRDLIRSMTSLSDNYDKKYMKMKLKWNGNLLLKEMLKL